jgi:formylglycine-generating enzyme required for sulfatase activity
MQGACAAVSLSLIIRSVVASEDSAPPQQPAPPAGSATATPRGKCPSDMVRVQAFCVDRYEASMIDKATGRPLSPYYPPHPRLVAEVWQAWEIDRRAFGGEGARAMPLPELPAFQRGNTFDAVAVSRPRVVPQAYVPFPVAKHACENAGKRLCTKDEWGLACRGDRGTQFPYGDHYEAKRCNVWSFAHPGVVLHQSATFGHRDPRLNLVAEGGQKPLLKLTGALPACASHWGNDAIYDMVGNVDEWVEADKPEFDGGFYARATKNGCDSRVTNHAAMYYDYSLGVRCCQDPR